MDTEQELLSMMSNDILSEAYKETLKDLDLEESVIDILTKDLISKMLVKKQSLRLNIEQTLEHPWFEKMKTRNEIIYKRSDF